MKEILSINHTILSKSYVQSMIKCQDRGVGNTVRIEFIAIGIVLLGL